MEKKAVTHVSDAIGDEYKKWHFNETIFIKTPTGSGKSTFILEKLLKHVVNINGKILYLVNRKILKNQLEEKIDDIADEYDCAIDIKEYINIWTYQKIENLLAENSLDEKYYRYFNKFNFVIYDECHYFFCDAAFNTFTELSYDFLRNIYYKKVQIFLSATMDNILPILMTRKEFHTGTDSEYRFFNKTIIYDNIKPDYSYIDIQLLEDKKDLLNKILNNLDDKKEKWLIFVDSISYGNKLYEEINNYYKESNKTKEDYNDIIFIDAKFKNNDKTKEEVDNIIKEKRSKKILITTSVMDNGISLEDEYLRNVVIMADIEETFIQMLGRKRIKNINEKIKLYILKLNVSYFRRKLNNIKQILKFYNNNKYNYEVFINNNICNLILRFPDENTFKILNSKQLFNSHKNLLIELLLSPYKFNEIGFRKNPNIQQKLLINLLTNSIKYEDIYKKLFYSYFGILEFNSFSIEYYRYLKNAYNNIINNLEKDDYFFIKRQLSWLGFEKNDEQIKELFDNLDEKHRKHLIEALNNATNNILSCDENKILKSQIREDLEYFLKKCKLDKKDNNLIRNATRPNETISEETFNKSMNLIYKFIGLKYIMYKTSNNEFKIQLIS